MSSLQYEDIFASFLGKITDYNLALLSEDDLLAMETEWLHSAISKPRFRRMFSSFSYNDYAETIKYELEHSVDKDSDDDFVEELIVLGMVIEWLEPKVNSVLYTAPMIGGKEEKKLLDDHSNMINRLDYMKKEQKKMIRDYGYMYNSYTGGTTNEV